MMAALHRGIRRGTPNFKTNLRYPVEHVIAWTRKQLEDRMEYACQFNSCDVEWFEYTALRLDDRDYLVFEVTGRTKVPIPADGNVEQLKDALL